MDGTMLFEDYLRSQIQLGVKSGVVIIPDLLAKGIADWIEENRNRVEVVRCKDCKHWRRQTNYPGAQLSFGFCDMWESLYGETCDIDTDDDFYCGYAERREDGKH